MLTNYPFLRSDDIEYCRAQYDSYGLGWRLLDRPSRQSRFRVEVNMVATPKLTMFCYSHSHLTEINPGETNPDHWLTFPIRITSGTAEVASIGVGREVSRLASPGRPDPHLVDGTRKHAGLVIDGPAIRRFFETLTGLPAKDEIVFDPLFDTRKSAARNVAHDVALWLEEEESEPGSGLHPLRLNDLFHRVASTLLLYHPNNYQDRFDRGNPGPSPRDVKRVVDFIEANADEPLTLNCLVQVSGVPARTLNEHFRSFVGLSPMAYLRRKRLQQARQELMSGTDKFVTEVALAWHFTNLGRFAAAYFRAFGERPSQTRARGRSRD